MKMYTYEKICEEVESGVKHMVLNIKRNEFGVVDRCLHGYFNVKVGDCEDFWAMGDCKEVDVEKTKNAGRLSTL